MKKSTLFTFLVIILALQSCVKDSCEQITTYIQTTPIYKTQAEIDAVQVTSEGAREMKKPGKIYFYNDYIFINEARKGIHIVDNSDKNNPQKIAFLNIEGNGDMAIKDDKLYADSYTDLWILDITNINDIQVAGRESSVFEPLWEYEGQIYVYNETEEITEVLDCETRNAMVNRGGVFFASDLAVSVNEAGGGSGGGGSSGTGGSMARFALMSNHLYAVGESTMNVFSLENPISPALVNNVVLGWGIETIFPHGDKFFIGSNSGMQIWDNSNPAQPLFLSEFTHARACDPVFVKDNYAYVTLRDGSLCQGFVNQIDLIDITDLSNPVLEKSFSMDNPHGLSIDGNNLFLCEGEHGLKVFDIEDPKKLANKKLDHIKDINSYDVIAVPGSEDVLLMIGDDGFFQYDYSDPKKLKEISRILID